MMKGMRRSFPERRRLGGVLAFLLALLAGGLAWASEVAVTERATDGGAEYVLRSDALEAVVNPALGGQVVSLIHRKSGVQLGNIGTMANGLFSDHDMKQPYPGELMKNAYSAELTREGGLRLERTAQGGWRNEALPSLKDLRYRRTLTLHPELPLLTLKIEVANTGGEDRLVDYWLQSIARVGVEGELNWYYRPAPEGVSVVSSDYAAGRAFVQQPVAGWMGVLNRKRRIGMVYLVDYDQLRRLYNCMPWYTQEFMYWRAPLPPGRSWQTTVRLRVVEGMDAFVHASERLVADLRIEEDDGRLSVTHVLAAFSEPLTGLRVQTALKDEAASQELSAPDILVESLGGKPVTRTCEFACHAGGVKTVKVTVTSPAGVDIYEKPVTLHGDMTGGYRRLPPPRSVRIERPDRLEDLWKEARAVKGGVLQLGDESRIQPWGLEAVARGLGLSWMPAEYQAGGEWRDPSFHPFPIALREIFKYDAVVLAEGDAMALGDFGSDMLKAYCEQGGRLLLLGGYRSFGKGRMTESPLAEWIPVIAEGPWELRRTDQPVAAPGKDAPEWVKGLPWRENPRVFWAHALKAAPGAEVWLTVDNRPLLLSKPVGRGRVTAFTGTCLGTDEEFKREGGVPIWQWSGYAELMRCLLGDKTEVDP